MNQIIPQFLLPRGIPSALRRPQPKAVPILRPHRLASTAKPRVLERPTRFNPPSHGRRLRKDVPKTYGPELSAAQKTVQETKQYPRMMPPEGSFMHWFLTNRGIHTWITMGTLVSLASFVTWENWKHSTIFRSRLPEKEYVLIHPVESFRMLMHAIRLNIAETSDRVHEERMRGVEDMQKRASYRKMHGGSEDDGVEFWPPFENRENALEKPIGFIPGGDTQEKRVKKWFGIF